MNINITLFLQIINFLVSYVILTKLLLRPAIEFFNQEQKVKESLEEKLIAEDNKFEHLKDTKDKRWRECQRSLKELSPIHLIEHELDEEIYSELNNKAMQTDINNAYIKELSEDIAKNLESKFINSSDK